MKTPFDHRLDSTSVRAAAAGLLGALLFALLLALPGHAQTGEIGQTSYTYTVQQGDSWSIVAQETGVSIADLKRANPNAVRANDWLIVGEDLVIPTAQSEPLETYTVQPGESWNSIADALGIPVSLLKAANPRSIRANDVLVRGERLKVPPSDLAQTPATPTDAPTATPTAEAATPEPTATPVAPKASPTAEREALPTATPAQVEEEPIATTEPTTEGERTYLVQPGESWNSIAQTLDLDVEALRAANPDLIRPGLVLFADDLLTLPAPGADTSAEPAAEAAATDEPGEAVDIELPACPAAFADYPDVLQTLLATAGATADTLARFLESCGVTPSDGIMTGDWTGDGLDDLAVAYGSAESDATAPAGELLIFNGAASGYTLAYRAGASGAVRILAADDVNRDERADIVWLDTTCGASTCFDTVMVYSWDGKKWAKWTDGNVTMAYADVKLTDVSEAGQGDEVVLDGGVYGSVGAGPQRSRTEVWRSVDGKPYTRGETTFAESNCLYHVVLDANSALLDAPTSGFDEAEALYTKAVGDEDLVKCWVRDNEMDELRSFSYFRLAQIAAYQGLPDVAGDLVGALAALYPESTYAEVGDVWLSAYEESGDVQQACKTTHAYVEDAPEAWTMLADYGYANPGFTAADVCPVLDVEVTPQEETAAPSAALARVVATPTPTAKPEAVAVQPAVGGDAERPADCPDNVDRFAGRLPATLASLGGDQTALEEWLRSCDALDDDRGAVRLTDLTGDGLTDAVVMPTIVSDLGYGPGGSQGAVLIYHAQPDGSFELAHNPDVFGQPSLLATEDLNADGQMDVAWTVESCSTFCVIEVQMVSWDGSAYGPMIKPGATMAEGKASFAPLTVGALGKGLALMLTGGVSGVPEGGLAVAHTETWQSVDGAPYQRLSWAYDRTVEGNDCLGLRLIEADVAMDAAVVLGYDDAIELYRNALDNSLQACSLFGMPADDELILLQGLTSFRLIQAQALGGESTGAAATLLALQSGQPDSQYTAAAAQWLADFNADGDPAAACAAVLPIFEENDELWRITDQFGYNHPALAAGQICFVP